MIKQLLFSRYNPIHFSSKKTYRVKEFNSAYDEIMGKGKGWIYISNPTSKFNAKLLLLIYKSGIFCPINHNKLVIEKVKKINKTVIHKSKIKKNINYGKTENI